MRQAVKPRKKRAKRDLFAELMEGMDALADARQGKRTLRTHWVEFSQPPLVWANGGSSSGTQSTTALKDDSGKG